jgi:hypothetical protein
VRVVLVRNRVNHLTVWMFMCGPLRCVSARRCCIYAALYVVKYVRNHEQSLKLVVVVDWWCCVKEQLI